MTWSYGGALALYFLAAIPPPPRRVHPVISPAGVDSSAVALQIEVHSRKHHPHCDSSSSQCCRKYSHDISCYIVAGLIHAAWLLCHNNHETICYLLTLAGGTATFLTGI
jgi:hypothetical protein